MSSHNTPGGNATNATGKTDKIMLVNEEVIDSFVQALRNGEKLVETRVIKGARGRTLEFVFEFTTADLRVEPTPIQANPDGALGNKTEGEPTVPPSLRRILQRNFESVWRHSEDSVRVARVLRIVMGTDPFAMLPFVAYDDSGKVTFVLRFEYDGAWYPIVLAPNDTHMEAEERGDPKLMHTVVRTTDLLAKLPVMLGDDYYTPQRNWATVCKTPGLMTLLKEVVDMVNPDDFLAVHREGYEYFGLCFGSNEHSTPDTRVFKDLPDWYGEDSGYSCGSLDESDDDDRVMNILTTDIPKSLRRYFLFNISNIYWSFFHGNNGIDPVEEGDGINVDYQE